MGNRRETGIKIGVLLMASIILITGLFAAGCTDQGVTNVTDNSQISTGEESSVNTEPQSSEAIVFGMPNWPGVTVKTHVVKNILESEGYDVEILTIADPGLIYTSMAKDNGIDVLLGGWLPTTQKPYWDKYKDDLELVNININSTWLGLGVPDYVYNAGIHSIADLKGNASKFEGRIVTLEAGNGMTIAAEKSIKEYGLKDFEVLVSSTPAMLAEVKRAESREDWIVFCAWEPHYMMTDYHVKKLNDPNKLFGDNEDVVYTVARKEFSKDYPKVYKFLKEFQVPVEAQNYWIGEYGRNERDPDEVAKEWINNNQALIQSWDL
ncbi:MAG: glycine betaine ABC transporter substrate-binding protein [Euryarchaeota archaeon]|nr:glycine betaine ABC transporter substrate-binding protein [Euryarchaeota archaeon]